MSPPQLPPTLILLPGMDGTGNLFGPLMKALGSAWHIRRMHYPTTVPLDYGGLEALVARDLPTAGPYWLLGESFSGPIAIMLAARNPPGLRGLVLCSTFARNPRPKLGWLRYLTGVLALLPLPGPLLGPLLLGRFTTPKLRAAVLKSLSQVRSKVLAARMQAVLQVDVAAQLKAVRVPVLYLCGTEDPLVPRRASQALKTWRRNLQWAELTAPHALLQCVPEDAAELLRDFVQATSQEPAAAAGS